MTMWELSDSIECMVIFVARYMHQSERELQEMSLSDLRFRHDKVLALVLAELGGDKTRRETDEWT